MICECEHDIKEHNPKLDGCMIEDCDCTEFTPKEDEEEEEDEEDG